MITDVERRCLVDLLRRMLKDAKDKNKLPVKSKDNYWEITIKHSNKNKEDKG